VNTVDYFWATLQAYVVAVFPEALTLTLHPQSRLDFIDITPLLSQQAPAFLQTYRYGLYYSYHTTAGYPEQRLCERLGYRREALEAFFQTFQRLFPPEADYHHDRLELRQELSERQRHQEPRNADAHLTFIGAGLLSGAVYRHLPDKPIYFVDLDGIYNGYKRTRTTIVVGFNQAKLIAREYFSLRMPHHRIASVNLCDSSYGFWDALQAWLQTCSVSYGRLDLLLPAEETHAALTINEYETLLMRHDLAEVLRNPFRFMAQTGLHALQNPRAVPAKALSYAKYDLVRLTNELIDKLHLHESLLERVLNKFLALPAARFLRMRRAITLLIGPDPQGYPILHRGRYQTPILIQWERPLRDRRVLEARLYQFH